MYDDNPNVREGTDPNKAKEWNELDDHVHVGGGRADARYGFRDRQLSSRDR